MKGKRWTRLTGVALVAVGLLLTLGGVSTTAMADPSDGAISGTVTDAASHSGLAGIEVCAEVPSSLDFECATTDGTGSYTITGLAPESYTVRFYADSDHVDQYFDGVTNYNDATLVQVTAGATTTSIDAVMQIASKITGTVTDAISHAPIEGISACATKLDGSFRRCGFFSGSDGTYAITGLDPGSYKVRFYQESLGGLDSSENYLEQFYDGVRQESQAQSVSVTTGHITTGIDAAMEEGGIITGKVTDAVTGDPLPYTWVCASHYEEEAHGPLSDRCTEAETDGSYLIAGLSTGDYAIYSDHVPTGPLGDGKLNYAPEFYSAKLTFETATPVHVTERQTFPGISLAMHKGATIAGTVVDAETHQPVPDVVVDLYSSGYGDYSDEPAFGDDQTGADGRFKIVGYPTGDVLLYMVPFGSSDGLYPNQYLSGKATGWDAERISLVAGHDTSLGDVELFKEIEGSQPEESEPEDPGQESVQPSDPGPTPGGVATPSSQPSPAPQPSQPRRSTPQRLVVKLSAPTQSLGIIAKTGTIKTSCRLSSAGRCVVVATISAKVAKALGLKVKKGAKSVTIGRGKARLGKPGSAQVKVKLSRIAKAALAKAKALKVKLIVTAGGGRKSLSLRLKG
jgi:carboxypeptidase family protein